MLSKGGNRLRLMHHLFEDSYIEHRIGQRVTSDRQRSCPPAGFVLPRLRARPVREIGDCLDDRAHRVGLDQAIRPFWLEQKELQVRQ